MKTETKREGSINHILISYEDNELKQIFKEAHGDERQYLELGNGQKYKSLNGVIELKGKLRFKAPKLTLNEKKVLSDRDAKKLEKALKVVMELQKW